MPNINAVLSNRNRTGWVQVDVYTTGSIHLEVPPDPTIDAWREAYMVDKWINVTEAADEQSNHTLRGRKQQRQQMQPVYQKDFKVEQLALAMEICEYVDNWREFYTEISVTATEYDALPKAEQGYNDRIAQKFFKKEEVPFDKDLWKNLVRRELVFWLIATVFNKQDLLKKLEEDIYQLEEKNLSNGSLLNS